VHANHFYGSSSSCSDTPPVNPEYLNWSSPWKPFSNSGHWILHPLDIHSHTWIARWEFFILFMLSGSPIASVGAVCSICQPTRIPGHGQLSSTLNDIPFENQWICMSPSACTHNKTTISTLIYPLIFHLHHDHLMHHRDARAMAIGRIAQIQAV
jgi:hypothetical protein